MKNAGRKFLPAPQYIELYQLAMNYHGVERSSLDTFSTQVKVLFVRKW